MKPQWDLLLDTRLRQLLPAVVEGLSACGVANVGQSINKRDLYDTVYLSAHFIIKQKNVSSVVCKITWVEQNFLTKISIIPMECLKV